MAHLLPPAGITYPVSDSFRNYLVRPPAGKQQDNKIVICCERTRDPGNGCRENLRCRVVDGGKTYPLKVCPEFSDAVTGFCRKNDCPQPAPRPCSYATRAPCRDPCDPCPPCEKPTAATYINPCPTPCPNPWRRPPTQRVCSATCGNRPKLVKETVTSHVYTRQCHGDPQLERLRFAVDEVPVHYEEPPKLARKQHRFGRPWDESSRARELRLKDNGYPKLNRYNAPPKTTCDNKKKERTSSLAFGKKLQRLDL